VLRSNFRERLLEHEIPHRHNRVNLSCSGSGSLLSCNLSYHGTAVAKHQHRSLDEVVAQVHQTCSTQEALMILLVN